MADGQSERCTLKLEISKPSHIADMNLMIYMKPTSYLFDFYSGIRVYSMICRESMVCIISCIDLAMQHHTARYSLVAVTVQHPCTCYRYA